MKTKFVLHGGFASGSTQEDDNFFQEILSSAPKETKILLVYFAKDASGFLRNGDNDMAQFTRNKSDKILLFDVADEKLFREQMQWADAVYFGGGSSAKLLDTLKKFSDFKELCLGKIIAGDSAGASVFAKVFYSRSSDVVSNGLGLIPVKIICHFSEKYKNKLDVIRPDLETLFLPEYQFRTFDINVK